MRNKFGIPEFTKEGYFKKLVDEGVVKWRHEHKGKPIEDLDKAIWFLNKLKDTYEK